MTDELPAPLVPPDVDLRGFSRFMLDVDRLLASELLALGTPEECWAAFMLWCRAFKQTPAGSLPNDDRVLAAFSGAGKRWPKVKAMALRGFVLCSDGRLYHHVVAEQVLEAWKNRVRYQTDQERLKRWREQKRNATETTSETRFKDVSPAVSEPEDRTGQDRTGQESKNPPSEVVGTPSAADLTAAVAAYNAVARRCGLPLAEKLTDQRKAKLRSRLRESGVDAWNTALVKLAANLWMHGENDRGWRANFDFLLQAQSFTKLVEGAYDRPDDAAGNGSDGHVPEPRTPRGPPPALPPGWDKDLLIG